MRPEKLPVRVRDGHVLPIYLSEVDRPWIAALLELVEAHRGARWRELDARLREPVLEHAPPRGQALAVTVLRRLLRGRIQAAAPPRRVRRTLFLLAASGGSRQVVLAAAAQELSIDPAAVEAALFSDLPRERRVDLPARLPSPSELGLSGNLHLVRALLSRATTVEIRLRGNARAILRVARLRGLLCTIDRGDPPASDVTLHLSGPLSLFRRTTLYGRALGSLMPTLAWADSFDLLATCQLGDHEARLRLRSGDPFLPAEAPRRYDSAVEEHLARQLARRAVDWIVVREPEPISVGSTFLFPDFALQHRYASHHRWLLEIVGFWTPEYLESKLRNYRQAGLDRLILCIDDRRACAEESLPAGARIVRYRSRVDVEAVLGILSSVPSPTSPGDPSPARK